MTKAATSKNLALQLPYKFVSIVCTTIHWLNEGWMNQEIFSKMSGCFPTKSAKASLIKKEGDFPLTQTNKTELTNQIATTNRNLMNTNSSLGNQQCLVRITKF